MEDEKHLEARLYLLASKLPTPHGSRNFGNKMKLGEGAAGREGSGKDPQGHSILCSQGFFLMGETHTIQGHTVSARRGPLREAEQWEQQR